MLRPSQGLPWTMQWHHAYLCTQSNEEIACHELVERYSGFCFVFVRGFDRVVWPLCVKRIDCCLVNRFYWVQNRTKTRVCLVRWLRATNAARRTCWTWTCRIWIWDTTCTLCCLRGCFVKKYISRRLRRLSKGNCPKLPSGFANGVARGLVIAPMYNMPSCLT